MIFYLDPQHFIDTSSPIDLSMGLSATSDNPRAWYVDAPRMEPVRANGFVGSVAEVVRLIFGMCFLIRMGMAPIQNLMATSAKLFIR